MTRLKTLLLSVAALTLLSANPSPPAAATINIKSLSYDPKQVDVVVGQSVVWKNTARTEHSATSDDTPALFDTGMISPGQESKPVVFDKAGTFKFHCALHGKTMYGTIVVK